MYFKWIDKLPQPRNEIQANTIEPPKYLSTETIAIFLQTPENSTFPPHMEILSISSPESVQIGDKKIFEIERKNPLEVLTLNRWANRELKSCKNHKFLNDTSKRTRIECTEENMYVLFNAFFSIL